MFGRLEKWKPVKEVLDFSDEGESIFCRKKSLAEKTLERIYAGLVKFVAGGKEAFISRYNTVRPQDTVKSIKEPCGVLTTANRFAKVQVSFLSKQFSGQPDCKIYRLKVLPEQLHVKIIMLSSRPITGTGIIIR